VSLDDVIERYFLMRTGFTPLHLFNAAVRALQADSCTRRSVLEHFSITEPDSFLTEEALAGSGQGVAWRREAKASSSKPIVFRL
jgi:hypothetical protein